MLVHPWRYFFLAVFSCALITGAVQTANACSCGPQPTVLDAFDHSDEVVILRAISVEKVPDNGTEHYVSGVRRTTMVVERVFKGKLKVRDQIVFGQGGGADCVWTFNEKAVGQQFLFYLNSPEKRPPFDYHLSTEPGLWFAFGCGRSGELAGVTEDLLFLENMKKLRGKTRISGTLGGWQNPDLNVENKRIKIIGAKKTYETKTDEHGVFEIYDLPPGKYFIEPETPAGWKLAPHWLRYSPSVVENKYGNPEMKTPNQVAITLAPKKHAGVNFVFESDNFVRGRVVGPKGKPMSGVCVYLLRPGAQFGSSGCTNEQGRYEIASVAPGEYVLGANQDDKPSSREPFRSIFYPGVSERQCAVVLDIRPGEILEDMDFVIPKLEETIVIKGILRYSDGNPASEEWVKFKVMNSAEKIHGDASEKTDSDGRFTLTVLKGLQGEVAGENWLFKGFYKNCPKADELIAKSGNNGVTVYSNVLKLTTDEDVYDVELTLPVPRCEKP